MLAYVTLVTLLAASFSSVIKLEVAKPLTAFSVFALSTASYFTGTLKVSLLFPTDIVGVIVFVSVTLSLLIAT